MRLPLARHRHDFPQAPPHRMTGIRRLFVGMVAWLTTSVAWAVRLLGMDPKDILEKVFGTAQKSDPKLRDVYLARGDLAMDKHDFALAAKAYEEGLKEHPDDPDLLCGRALAYANGEHEVAITSLQAALK